MPRRPKRATDAKAVVPTNGAHEKPRPGPLEPAENGAPTSPAPLVPGDPNGPPPPPHSEGVVPPPTGHAARATTQAGLTPTPTPDAANGAPPPPMRSSSTSDQVAQPASPLPNGAATPHEVAPTPPAHTAAGTRSDLAASPTGGLTAPLAIRDPNGLAKSDSEGPRLAPDPGLYAVLGLDPSASDVEIQTTYRRQAARMLNSGTTNTHAMRELNVAYEVLGNPVRREEYDRVRRYQSMSQSPPGPVRPGAKAASRITRRTRPRHVVQPRYAGLPDVLAVIVVVGLAVLAGALIIPRLSIDLSPLKALQNVLPLSNTTRRVIDATVTPAATNAAPTATPRPGVVERFASSAVSVSSPNPAPNSQQSVVLRLRRDGQPAANFDVWSTVQYRTTEERWPPSGSVKTDASGTATITFNVGGATPNFPVQVRVFVQADDQQLTWSTSFTPR